MGKAGGVPPEIDSCQAAAGTERIVLDVGDAGAHRDGGQAGSSFESTKTDVGDAVGDRDVGRARVLSR